MQQEKTQMFKLHDPSLYRLLFLLQFIAQVLYELIDCWCFYLTLIIEIKMNTKISFSLNTTVPFLFI
jgi:hypothetical protein